MTFHESNHWFSTKWCQWNERINSILITCHYQVLYSIIALSKLVIPWRKLLFCFSLPWIKSTSQIRSVWVVTSHQYGISPILLQMSFYKETSLFSEVTPFYPASRVTSIFPRWVGKEEATLPTSSSSFDLSIIQRFGWVRQVSYWINQFYLCMHTYSGVLLTLSVPTLHNKINSCCFNFMQEFWENYRLNVQFQKNWKMHPDLRWILFWI